MICANPSGGHFIQGMYDQDRSGFEPLLCQFKTVWIVEMTEKSLSNKTGIEKNSQLFPRIKLPHWWQKSSSGQWTAHGRHTALKPPPSSFFFISYHQQSSWGKGVNAKATWSNGGGRGFYVFSDTGGATLPHPGFPKQCLQRDVCLAETC